MVMVNVATSNGSVNLRFMKYEKNELQNTWQRSNICVLSSSSHDHSLAICILKYKAIQAKADILVL